MHLKKNEATLIRLSDGLKSIAHPVRIEILRLLNDNASRLSVTQIHEQLGLSQPETSRHLSLMRKNGVLQYEKRGVNAYYSINHNGILSNCISGILQNT